MIDMLSSSALRIRTFIILTGNKSKHGRSNCLTMSSRTQIFSTSQFLILSFYLFSWFKTVATAITVASHNSAQHSKEGEAKKALHLGYSLFFWGRINLPQAAVCSDVSLAMDHITHIHTNHQERVIGIPWLA